MLQTWYSQSKSKLNSENQDDISIPNARYFNPNRLSSAEWESLGFKNYISKQIIRYRLAGGEFRKKEDVLKITGINKRLVKAYYEYMIIPKKEKKQYKHFYKSYKKATPTDTSVSTKKIMLPIVKKNINLATATELQKVNGIGTFISGQLIKQRDKLGGFIYEEQLHTIYGIMDEGRLTAILNHFFVPSVPLSKISINADSFKVLARHPYISYKVSRAILKYRSQHGDYQSIEELKKIYFINDSLYATISPYLKVE